MCSHISLVLHTSCNFWMLSVWPTSGVPDTRHNTKQTIVNTLFSYSQAKNKKIFPFTEITVALKTCVLKY